MTSALEPNHLILGDLEEGAQIAGERAKNGIQANSW